MSVVLFLMTAHLHSTFFIPIVGSGSIVYPIVNTTSEYTFTFVGIQSTPSTGGPSCSACRSSNCANPCASVSNPNNCQCSLSQNGYQWFDNMKLSEGQLLSITYTAHDSSGNYVSTFTVVVDLDNYGRPEVNVDDGEDLFGVLFENTANNSTYSGPCWAIVLAPI